MIALSHSSVGWHLVGHPGGSRVGCAGSRCLELTVLAKQPVDYVEPANCEDSPFLPALSIYPSIFYRSSIIYLSVFYTYTLSCSLLSPSLLFSSLSSSPTPSLFFTLLPYSSITLLSSLSLLSLLFFSLPLSSLPSFFPAPPPLPLPFKERLSLVALADLNSQSFTCLCLPSVRTKGICHHSLAPPP